MQNMSRTMIYPEALKRILTLGLMLSAIASAPPLRADDQELDAQLAAFRAHNGGKPPDIFYILIDDIGFSDLGRPSKSIFQGRQHARNRPW